MHPREQLDRTIENCKKAIEESMAMLDNCDDVRAMKRIVRRMENHVSALKSDLVIAEKYEDVENGV